MLTSTLLAAFVVVQASGWTSVGSAELLPGDVTQFEVSPDGRWVATCGEDGRLALWDASNGAQTHEFAGVAPRGVLVAFSPDSQLVVAHAPLWKPTTLRVWRTSDGTELRGWSTLELGPGDERTSRAGAKWREGPQLHLHPSGATVFHPSDYGSVLVSSTRTFESVAPMTHRRWSVLDSGGVLACVRTSGVIGGEAPSGQRDDALEVRLFRVADGAQTACVTWRGRQSESAPFPGDHVCVGADEVALVFRGEVHVLGMDSAERARFGVDVTALAGDGAQRVTGHRDGSVSFWEGTRRLARVGALARPVRGLKLDGSRVLAEGEGTYALVEHDRRVLGPQAAFEGRLFAGALLLRDDERGLRCFVDGKLTRTLATPGFIYDEYDSRNVPCAVRGDSVWFLADGRLSRAALHGDVSPAVVGAHFAAIERVEFGPRDALLFGDGRVARVASNGARGRDVLESAEVGWFGDEVVALAFDEPRHRSRHAFARDGSAYATRKGASVRVVRSKGGERVHDFGVSGSALALSSDGARVATAYAADGREKLVVEVRDVESGATLWRTMGQGASGELLAFAPRGEQLAVRNGFGLQLFDGRGKLAFETPSGPAAMGEQPERCSFGWTPDAAKFITVSHARPVVVRSAESGDVLLEFDAPDECYGHFAQLWVAPDGEHIAAFYSERDVVYVWSTVRGRASEQRWVASGSSKPFAWLSGDEYVVATLDGARIARCASAESELLPDSMPATGVFVDTAGQRIAVARHAQARFYLRR